MFNPVNSLSTNSPFDKVNAPKKHEANLSTEQRKRIEKKRQLALERRQSVLNIDPANLLVGPSRAS